MIGVQHKTAMNAPSHIMQVNTNRLNNQAHLYASASSVVELRSVSCAYTPNRPAIRDISFSVREGEILCLLGPSGCGKTTILRTIAGFEPIRSGQIFLSGRLVSSPSETIPTEERRVGMVFQEYALFPHLRVAENIAFGLHHLSRAERNCRVQEMLQLTGLEGLDRRYPHELSGGQQQRVAIARALVQNPVLLLLDEPFSNLDPDMAGRMRQEVHALLCRTKTTTILVTHDHEEAFAIADNIAVLNHGHLEQLDSPELIYHMPATPFVAEFVGQADFITGQIRQGRVHTELGDFPNTLNGEEGTSVVVMIRPDDIHLAPNQSAATRIVSRQFRGSENLYTVRLPSGQLIHSSESSTSVYHEGTPVELRVSVTHTVLFNVDALPNLKSEFAHDTPHR
jgi:iron(III) transport system ATP-binding protein